MPLLPSHLPKMRSLLSLGTLLLAGLVVAAPSKVKTKTCTVPVGDGVVDDTPALMAILRDPTCTSNATILFSKGKSYNIYTPVAFPALK